MMTPPPWASLYASILSSSESDFFILPIQQWYLGLNFESLSLLVWRGRVARGHCRPQLSISSTCYLQKHSISGPRWQAGGGRAGRVGAAGDSAKPGVHTAAGGRGPSTCPVHALATGRGSRSCGGFPVGVWLGMKWSRVLCDPALVFVGGDSGGSRRP